MKMKGNKIVAALVVIALVLSAMAVLNTFDIKMVEKASAVPGVDDWGYPTNVTNEDPLVYDPDAEVDIDINTTGLVLDDRYYLYYPYYGRSGATYNLTWKPYKEGGTHKSIKATNPGQDETLSNIILNRSGLWVLNSTLETAVIKCNDSDNFNHTVDKWFWVNTSEAFTMTVNPDELYFGLNDTINITVKKGGDAAKTWIDIRRDNATQPNIHLDKETSGIFAKDTSWMQYFKWAGNYSIIAFLDIDDDEPDYYTPDAGFNLTWGSNPSVTADYYDYTLCGPWDPPEYNSTYDTIRVYSGEPATDIPEDNQTMYWSFDGEVNISIKGYDDDNLSHNLDVKIFNDQDQNVTANFTLAAGGNINKTNIFNGWIRINHSSWGRNGSVAGDPVFGGNGTWYAILYNNTDGDSGAPEYTDEWNVTVEWTVGSAPGVQWKWINDDGSASTDNNDGVIPIVPALINQPLSIQFQIIGDDHTYYGDVAASDAAAVTDYGQNITVSGDALFLSSKKLDKLGGVTCSIASGVWTVPLTPTMALNGGEIDFSVYWKDYGTLSETLTIGGSRLNGTIVTISPNEFTIAENLTFTVTVTDAVGDPMKTAKVYLRWVFETNRTLIGGTKGLIGQKLGGGSSAGEYEFFVNKSMQTTNQTAAYGSIMAPRNISVYVDLYRGGTPANVYGYAHALMEPKKDLKVTMEPSTVMAGQKIPKFWFNTTVVGSSGNTTGYPEDSGLKVRIYNSTGHDVTTTIGSLSTSDTDGNDNKTATNEYLQMPGTYTVHAWNATHNSEGNNGTLVVQPVDVTSSISEFIWGYDDNITSTFTVKYDGELINGTLRVDNITDVGDYNKTWALCNFTPQIGSTSGSDQAGENTSIQLTIKDGVATLSNITANNLPMDSAQKNITFYFKPKTPSGSAWAAVNGMMTPVKIPDVTPTPASMPVNEEVELEILLSGRGIPLGDMLVNITIPGLSGEQYGRSDANGIALFVVIPQAIGDITIEVENRTSDVKVLVTSWKLYLDADPEVDEGDSFTATVRNKTATGAGLAGASILFNRNTYTTGADGTVSIPAPSSVTSDREYTIKATLEGYAEDTETIMVVNVPKLVVVAPSEATAGSTFQVTIANDVGNAIVGATVTINNKDYTSGAQGIATLTAPSDEGNYQITASKTGFATSDPVTIEVKPGGIPGFELLTLIAAIGVAFILLKRRRH